MAKEVGLKKVELKVSVNCCDGCKKKVKKVLQSIEGVFKTEIDPLQQKVTILGNVEPQILIKKLLRAGKQAEIWSNQSRNAADKEKKEPEKEGSKIASQQAKCSDVNCNTSIDNKIKGNANHGHGGSSKPLKKDQNGADCVAYTTGHEVTKNENCLPPLDYPEANCVNIHPSTLHDTKKMGRHAQYCFTVEPCTITLPYYAVYGYQVVPSLTPPPSSYPRENYPNVLCPVIETSGTRVGDYFSVDNTVGCHLM